MDRKEKVGNDGDGQGNADTVNIAIFRAAYIFTFLRYS